MNIRQALLHNTGWKILAMLFGFVNNIIIVRLLGAEAGASLFFTLAIFTLMSTVLRFGLENGIVYYASKYPARTAPIARLMLIVTLIQSIIIYAALKYFVKEINSYTLLGALIFVLMNVLIYYVTAFYQVKRMYISINISAVVISFLQMAALLAFYFSRSNFLLSAGIAKNIKDAVLIILAGGAILQIIFLIAYFYAQRKNELKKTSLTLSFTKSIFNYSLVNFGATVLMFLVMRLDFWFVQKYCSAVVLGNYVQMARIGQMALVFPGLIGGIIFPFAVDAPEAFAQKVAFFCRVITMLFVCSFFLFAFAGQQIFIWLLGPDFYLVYTGLIATSSGIFFLAISMVFISYFEGKNMQRIVLLANALILMVIVICDSLLVPKYGYIAAALVFSGANLAGMIMLLKNFISKTGVSLREIFLIQRRDMSVLPFWKS